jgi:hypothetical protein
VHGRRQSDTPRGCVERDGRVGALPVPFLEHCKEAEEKERSAEYLEYLEY